MPRGEDQKYGNGVGSIPDTPPAGAAAHGAGDSSRGGRRAARPESNCGARTAGAAAAQEDHSARGTRCEGDGDAGSAPSVPPAAAAAQGRARGSKGSHRTPGSGGGDSAQTVNATVEDAAESSTGDSAGRVFGECAGPEVIMAKDKFCLSHQPAEGCERVRLEDNPSREGTTDRSVPKQAVAAVTEPRECVCHMLSCADIP
jgi:hypothetical protein